MTCLKTGFHAHYLPHNLYLYGDAYEVNGALIFRICQQEPEPIQGVKHFTIHDYSNWFDKAKTSMERNSTMVCKASSVEYHDYKGVPL